jgi:hypothetical protein
MKTSPLTATLIQSTILNAIANLLAQFFAQYGTDVCLPLFLYFSMQTSRLPD